MEIGLRSMERPEQIVDFQCRFAFDACPPLSAVLPRSQVVSGKLEILLAAAQPMSLFYWPPPQNLWAVQRPVRT